MYSERDSGRLNMHRSHSGRTVRSWGSAVSLAFALALGTASTARALNPIQVENALPGTPQAQWDIPNGDAGDPSIQGFATDISVNRGEAVHFKIDTNALSYHIDIYRLGYYNGDSARLQGAGIITATQPQAQPAQLHDDATGWSGC